MRIYLAEPFFDGSHRQWAEGLQQHSPATVRLFTLPARYWKWRMHGGAVSLARQLPAADPPDLLLTTDMLDVSTFRALCPPSYARVPLAVYFHENQLTYPWSPDDPDPQLGRDRTYAWINFVSALAADAVFFNSDYHRTSFLQALPRFLRAFPDHRLLEELPGLADRCRTLPLGMDLSGLEHPPVDRTGPLTLLWNHRWEYDKNPEGFFHLCYALQERKLPFQLIVLGEAYRHSPAVFAAARERLAAHVLHWGFAADRAEYACWLHRADVLPVTAVQDFFGGSTVEAVYCHTLPLLPDRLAYPGHVPPGFLYKSEEELLERVAALAADPEKARREPVRQMVEHYDWPRLIGRYSEAFASLAG